MSHSLPSTHEILAAHRLPSRTVPLRHSGRWVAAAAATLLSVYVLVGLATNRNLQWGTVGAYLFDHTVLSGVGTTIVLTALSMAFGIIIGLVVAIMRMSSNPVLGAISAGYIWFFRGTPLLVQLIFWFNFSAVLTHLKIGLPFGPTLFSLDTRTVITAMVAALLGLSLHESSHAAEIVRGGLLAVDHGQVEAAAAHGMSPAKTLRRIVIPQAMRVIVPPMGNRLINMLQMTSLVMVIGTAELLYSVQIIYSRTFQTIPLLIVAAIWYLFMVSVLSVGQHYVEKKYSRSSVATSSPLRRLFSIFRSESPVRHVGSD